MDTSAPNCRSSVWLPDPYGGGRDVPFIPAENSTSVYRQMGPEARLWRATAADADAGTAIPACNPMAPAVAQHRDTMEEMGIETVAGGVEVLVATLPPAADDGQMCGTYFIVDRWCRLRRDIPAQGGPVLKAGQEAFMSLVWQPGPAVPDPDLEEEIVVEVGGILELASTVELMWWHGVGWVHSPFKSQRPALLVGIVRDDTGHLGLWTLQSQATLNPLYLTDCDIKARIRLLPRAQKRWLRCWRSMRGTSATAPELHAVLSRLERGHAWLAPDDERVLRASGEVAALEEDAPDAFSALHGEILSLEPPLEMGATAETLDAVDYATAQQAFR
ncbi:MAG: hypothetical protein F4Z31_02205 [Gemmatimonadetes bacterium]|nr:hypothetical protein [Gemmatimonadota bacterium]